MRRQLKELITGVEVLNMNRGPTAKEIKVITADSREAEPGALFVALSGFTVDGHDYVQNAVSKGCSAVVVRKGRCRSFNIPPQTVCLEVDDTRKALGQIAASFWGHPSRQLKMIGITGTNGKTTCAYLIEGMIRKSGGNPGVIGTVNYRYNGLELPAPFTTPDPVVLHRLLRRMVDSGVTHVIMEVSSHALAQKRLEGVLFDVALFTNLSRDHLDFHGDMENYFASKKQLFSKHLKAQAKAVVVMSSDETAVDDSGVSITWGRRLAKELEKSDGWRQEERSENDIITCGNRETQILVRDFHQSLDGIEAAVETPAGNLAFRSPLIGAFNLRNLIGAAGVGTALKLDREIISEALSTCSVAPGRLEPIYVPGRCRVFVDYAHTPDALENILQTMREVASGRLIVIFGCGGDRDRGKRPMMGRIAGRLADVIVVTSDNPRTERPEAIITDIESGLTELGISRSRLETLLNEEEKKGYDCIISRREAIRIVMRHARPTDVVIISGKGHETYQQIGKRRFFFDDRTFTRHELAVIKW